MGTKARDKKLSLKKVTITNLHSEALQNVKAGTGVTWTACPSTPHTGCISFCGTVEPCDI